MTPIDYSDVQGLAAYGYAKMVEARYWLLRVRDAAAARAWIAWAPVSTAERRQPPPEKALQVAFTAPGLRALGLAPSTIAGFSDEFLAGMSAPALGLVLWKVFYERLPTVEDEHRLGRTGNPAEYRQCGETVRGDKYHAAPD